MENKTINPSCKNCNNFVQHYVILGLTFQPSECGHCTNKELTRKERMNFPFKNGCELWSPNTEKKANREKSILSFLENAEKHLNDIKQILKLDRQ